MFLRVLLIQGRFVYFLFFFVFGVFSPACFELSVPVHCDCLERLVSTMTYYMLSGT